MFTQAYIGFLLVLGIELRSLYHWAVSLAPKQYFETLNFLSSATRLVFTILQPDGFFLSKCIYSPLLRDDYKHFCIILKTLVVCLFYNLYFLKFTKFKYSKITLITVFCCYCSLWIHMGLTHLFPHSCAICKIYVFIDSRIFYFMFSLQ